MSQAPRTPKYELTRLQSLDELRSVAAAWDDLWWRGEGLFPTARATTVAQCAAQFAPNQPVCALVVSRGDRLLAALPLVGAWVKHVLPVGGLAGNAWTPAGDLLLDPDCDVAAVLDTLATGFVELAVAAGLARGCHDGFCAMAQVSTRPWGGPVWRHSCRNDSSWDAAASIGTGNATNAAGRAIFVALCVVRLRTAEQFGTIGFELHTPTAAEPVARLLRRGFEVEDLGWKGAAGSSVLSNPGMFDFFKKQAQQLATWGQLAVALLTINGEAIAFEYALAAKGTYAPVKVGYDPRFAEVKPGQLLRWHLLRTLHSEGRWSGVDFIGPISQATVRWSTTTYRLCRMVIAPPRFSSRLLLAGYRLAKYRGAPTAAEEGAIPSGEGALAPILTSTIVD